MMNILAVSLLLLGTITTHGVLRTSSPPAVVLKNGHRVVTVEYESEADGGAVITTRISNYFDQDSDHDDEIKIKEDLVFSRPKELVCDAFGKCKHKISTLLFNAKEKVSDTVHDSKDAVEETAQKHKHVITDGVSDKVVDVKETINQITDKAKEIIITQEIPERAHRTKEAVSDKIINKTDDIKEAAESIKETAEKEMDHIFRRGKDVFYYTFSPWAVKSLFGLVYLLGYTTAYGMTAWVTFISSHVLAKSLSRQQFGIVQSKIYPVYFKALSLSIGVSLMGHLLGQWRRLKSRSPTTDMFQLYTLLSALLLTLVNLWYLEPKATKVMFERMKVERELEGRGKVQETGKVVGVSPAAAAASESEKEDGRERKKVEFSERLKKLNTYSSLLNVLTLMALTSHLVYLGQLLSLVM